MASVEATTDSVYATTPFPAIPDTYRLSRSYPIEPPRRAMKSVTSSVISRRTATTFPRRNERFGRP
jgi:hypothetical protein